MANNKLRNEFFTAFGGQFNLFLELELRQLVELSFSGVGIEQRPDKNISSVLARAISEFISYVTTNTGWQVFLSPGFYNSIESVMALPLDRALVKARVKEVIKSALLQVIETNPNVRKA